MITGTVIDAENSDPVEFATIALIDPESGKPINGNVADETGGFIIEHVAEGTYEVAVSFIGYESRKIDSVAVTQKRRKINLGKIELSASIKVLKEVVVEGHRPIIEEKVDRTIYNAASDKTTQGGDATDVLKRVPMLTVDMDGNVSLRGNQNIRVLINNKPSIIAASSIADALKQIPADQIQSVEVITSPSAKYDAEGSAGIINIITKKDKMQGAMLNVNSGVGYRGSNLGLRGSFRKGKMGFSLGGYGRAQYNVNGTYSNNQTTTSNTGERMTMQNAATRTNALRGRYSLGWDYDINKNNYMTASVQYGVRNNKNFQDQLLTQTFEGYTRLANNTRNVEVTDNSGTVSFNLDYVHTFKKPQQEFSVSGQYSKNNRVNNFLNSFTVPNQSDSLIKNINDSYNEEMIFQTDYQTPIGKTQRVEFGVKETFRKVTSNYTYLHTLGDGNGLIEIANANSTNIFTYNQNVSAGYFSYTLSLPKAYSLKAGARYEYTAISADFQNPNGLSTKIPSYGLLVPSINFSKRLKNGNLLKAGFNRRIQRPSIRYLNPNVQASNPLYITVGNPDLRPEYTNNFELAYSTSIKNSTINIAAFARNTTGAIQSIRSVLDKNVIQTTYANIGVENAYGFNFYGTLKIGPRFSLNGGTDIYYAYLNNKVSDSLYHAGNSGWVATARLRSSFDLNNGWSLEGFTMFRGRQVQLQGIQGGIRIYSLGAQKELFKDKGSIGFRIENFMASGLVVRNYTRTPLINQKSVSVMHNFSFQVNFSFRIGKMNFDKPKRKKQTKTNDEMDW